MSRRRGPRRAKPDSDAKSHIAFLRQWRKVLRLPLNAEEARILDGSRSEPRPGVLKHLVGKVDRTAIEAALARRPLSDDASQRARFLAGAAALTQDAGVLLDALEAQRIVAPRPEVQRAFGRAIRQLDLSRLSHARLARLLGLVDLLFEPAERLSTAFSLLRSPAFRSALEKTSRRLPPETSAHWLPLAAVHQALSEGSPPPDQLERGLRILLDAPSAVLDAQPNRLRFGLVTLALNLDASWPLTHPAIDRIVGGLDPEDVAWAGLAFNRAAGQVRLGRYQPALDLLDRILEHHPQDLRASVLLAQLAAPRLGPVALPDARPGALRAGFALSLLQPVLVRTDAEPAAIAIHRELALPGLAAIVLADSDTAAPWFAVEGGLATLDNALPQDRSTALQVAASGVRIAGLLVLAGLTLPDLGPHRFLVDTSPNRRWIELADLTGVRREPQIAEAHMRTLAAAFVRGALAERPFTRSAPRADLRATVAGRLDRHLTEPPALADLARWVDGLR